ncbi:MAG: aminotransferase class I/II-fold pyridoxal phosphate-dependent enzyme, partial [Burkholderiaceae bacterium]|nr:aminotransferase class I/II-fold pyridoxal phosphate-dependent enzyme [Burkholderiaceae bacterium]
MNPDLQQLQPYPFERLRALFADLKPPTGLPPIDLSIGEPKHPTPPLVRAALVQALDGLSVYPATVGSTALREAIAAWIGRRFGAPVDPATQVLPVNGTREALFALAQAVVDRTRPARVVLPNPFYQIYEGAALLAGARPLYLSTVPEDGFRMPFERLTASEWAQVQLVYVCSPGNPTGRVLRLDEWQLLFELSAR